MSARKAWNEAETKFGMTSNRCLMHGAAEEKIRTTLSLTITQYEKSL